MASLKIRLLGPFEVWRNDKLIAPEEWPTRKTQALLKVLVTEQGLVVPSDRLIEFLWPHLTLRSGTNSLHVGISHLRRTLEPELGRPADSAFILTRPQGYLFQVTSRCWIDVDAFHSAISHGHELERQGKWEPATAAYQSAEELYRGDYLEEDPYEDWAIEPREHLYEAYLDTLNRLGTCHAKQGNYRRALAAWQTILSHEPLRESVYRQVMLYHYRLGQRDQALQAFERCRHVLSEELGVDPMPETVDLHTRILREEIETEPAPIQSIRIPATPSQRSLPIPPTSFVGREKERDTVRHLLQQREVRILTLTGPAGVGKTRLALQLAEEVKTDFEHGVFFVSLAPITDPELVASAVAQSLDLSERGSRPLLEALVNYLHDKQLLLLLDNFEHVIAAATLVSEIVMACMRVKVVVTSREVLRLRGEHEFLVLPLKPPEPQHVSGAEVNRAAVLSQYAAVDLFVRRARAVKPTFVLNNENARAVAEICIRLDGLPLAIELAAARIKMFPPRLMLEQLKQRLRLLKDGPRDLPPRHQTLRRAIAWSYNLLDEGEKALFRWLAVFAGGFTLEAAEAVYEPSGERRIDLLGGLSSLVDKSLLRQEESPAGAPRFVMLETIREYGLEHLRDMGEAEATWRRCAAYFLALAEAAEPALRGPQQIVWMDRVESEHNNLRAVLQWALETGAAETGLRLAGSLRRFWEVRGHLSEGRRWLDRALSQSSGGAPSARAKALHSAGVLAFTQGDYTATDAFCHESLAIWRKVEDGLGISDALNTLGVAAHFQGDYTVARDLYEESLEIRRELDDKQRTAMTLSNLGSLALHQGDYAKARDFYEESLALCRELEDRWGVADCLNDLGVLAERQGDYATAQARLEESHQRFRALGDRYHVGISLTNLGQVAIKRGKYVTAATHLNECLVIFDELGAKRGVAYVMGCIAELAAKQEQPARAARLFGAATALRESIGAPMPPARRADYERNVLTLRARLGEEGFEAARADGRGMPLEQAIAYASKEATGL